MIGGTAIVACSGDDGAQGPAGATGPAGAAGQTGAAGPQGLPGTTADAGNPLTQGACTTPCHTFGGVVDQWRFSNHSHPQENEIGTGVCGNCHGIDGIQNRVANNFVVPPDAGTATDVNKGHIGYTNKAGSYAEISYGGATTIGRIHCSTCHDFNSTNDPHVVGKYTAGQAPLRVAGGPDDTVFIERSPEGSPTSVGQSVKYRAANTCIMCHKSRKDVVKYITNSNTLSSRNWGPHEGPQADVYTGLGGYHFAGASYSKSKHTTLTNACVECHMAPNPNNGNVPDHTMKPSLGFCTNAACHSEYTGKTFDIQGGQSSVKKALSELQALLNAKNLLTRAEAAPYGALDADDLADAQFNLDRIRPASGDAGANQVVDGPTAGAIYNYFIIARSKDFGVHNPTYVKQLLWDSIKQIKGSDPSSLSSRPL